MLQWQLWGLDMTHEDNLFVLTSHARIVLLCGVLGRCVLAGYFRSPECTCRSSFVTCYIQDFLRLTVMYLVGVSGHINRNSFQKKLCPGSCQALGHLIEALEQEAGSELICSEPG